MFRYLTHPDVCVDPDTPVPEWSLSDRGRSRTEAFSAQPWLGEVGRIVSSPETKARQTASIIAARLGLPVEVREGTGEIDRSSTGFVDATEHERLADRCFARPEESAAGWERAVDAQARVAAALDDLLAPASSTVVVGHGGVGTLLYCRLARLPIDRRHDQPAQGHYWTFDPATGRIVHAWRAIEAVDGRWVRRARWST